MTPSIPDPQSTRTVIAALPSVEGAILDIRSLGRTPTEPSFTPLRQYVFPLRGVHFLNDGANDLLVDLNQIAIVRERSVTQDRHPSQGDMSCLIVTPAADLLEELAAHEPGAWREGSYCLPMPSSIQIAARQVLGLVAQGEAPPCVEEALLNLVSASALVEPPSRKADGKRGRLVRKVREFLIEDFQSVGLQRAALEFGVSPAYLTSTFQQCEGMPLYRYHLRLRLSEALLRLPAADDITALALDLGFSSHSHFTGAFRARFGLTPSRYRTLSRNPRVGWSPALPA